MSMKVYYIHGYKSSCKSGKAKLAQELGAECIEYGEEELVSGEIFDKLESIEEEDIVIGSSLGGYLALYSKARTKILLNPLMDPKQLLLLGPYNGFVNGAKAVDDILNDKIKIYSFLGKHDEVLAHDFKKFKEISREVYVLDDDHNFHNRRKLLFTILKELILEMQKSR